VTDKKQFNDILNTCLEGLLTGSMTVDECLKQYPEQAHELAPLLQTALSVEHAVDIEPAPEAKAHGRYHLQLKMADTGKHYRSSYRNWQPRWAIAVMTALLVLILGSGTVFASNSSMPGSPLYPVKIATENVRLSMTGSAVAKAQLYATYAERRVVELGYIAEKGNVKSAQVEKIAKRYTYYVTQLDTLPLNGDDEMMTAAGLTQASGMEASADTPVLALAPATGTGTVTTTSASETGTPAISSAGTTDAQETSTSVKDTVGRTGITTPTEIVTNESGLSKLTSAELEHLQGYFYYLSTSQPQELEKFLDKFPEESKPAIRRMIQNAKESYPRLVQKIQRYQNQQGNDADTNNQKE
jgi:hypothetical protein